MVKGKTKFAPWITPECKKLVDDCYADDQCQSRSEYAEREVAAYAVRPDECNLCGRAEGSLHQKNIAYKDVTGAARETMRRIVDQLESVENPPESIQQKLLELALELRTVSGKKQYGYLKKPLKGKVDEIVDGLEKLPEVAAYYSVWNGLRDTLEGYYKSRPRQHNPLSQLSQQKEFRAIKNAIIQEAERLRLQLEESSEQTSANLPFATENTSSVTSQSVRLPSEYLLNSTVRLFHQMGQIFRDNAAPPSNPMGIRVDSKRRKKLMQKRLTMGHKQDDHEQEQGYEQSL